MKGAQKGPGTLSPSLGTDRRSSVGCARFVDENRPLQKYSLPQLGVCPFSLFFLDIYTLY